MNSDFELKKKLSLGLFTLRVGVFVVMFMWTLDKFVNPSHAKAVFENFYFLSGFEDLAMWLIGALELVLILAFLVGFQKRFTYGLVFLIHFVSTVSSFKQYLNPWQNPNLLFFAAWPMLAACYVLYSMRDHDDRFTIH